MKTNLVSDWRVALVATAMFLVLVAGCAAAQVSLKGLNGGIRVFGAQIGSVGIPPEISGGAATEEPCLKGYERIFDTLAVSIGYDHDGKIRKITTRNPETAMFGIHPGDVLAASREKALATGFKETAPANRFKGDCCSLTLLVGEDGRVFGMTVELPD